MGHIVGVVYALVQVRSPNLPLIALAGLLQMIVGERAIEVAKRHFVASSPRPIWQRVSYVHARRRLGR
jgi:XapX domain-containing protein